MRTNDMPIWTDGQGYRADRRRLRTLTQRARASVPTPLNCPSLLMPTTIGVSNGWDQDTGDG
jgi:hypothetical protein